MPDVQERIILAEPWDITDPPDDEEEPDVGIIADARQQLLPDSLTWR